MNEETFYGARCAGETKDHCISCGETLHEEQSGLYNHHCSKRHEAGSLGANRRFESPQEKKQTFYQRLREGFELVKQEYD